MYIQVKRLTNIGLTKELIEHVTPRLSKSNMTEEILYLQEHSIMRTQLYLIKFTDIPTFVAVHLIRHSQTGQFWYVESKRDDWSGEKGSDVTRDAPVNMCGILNAQHLVDISRQRLCSKAHKKTQDVWLQVKEAVALVDTPLADVMVPSCYYRNGICVESKPCGRQVMVLKSLMSEIPERIYRDARLDNALEEQNKTRLNNV